MRKISFLVLFVFCGFSSFAQADYKEKTEDLIEKVSGAQFEVLIQPLVDMVPEANKAAFKAEIQSSMEGLYSEIATVYMERFTEEDIDAMLAFYNSPIGKKMIAETPEITARSMQIGQTWGMKLQPIMAKYSN